jgi:hypothetical protein
MVGLQFLELFEAGRLWKGVLPGSAQNLPKFQIPCLTQKSVPDGDSKVSLEKMTPS